jgi:hypothetical protein
MLKGEHECPGVVVHAHRINEAEIAKSCARQDASAATSEESGDAKGESSSFVCPGVCPCLTEVSVHDASNIIRDGTGGTSAGGQ